VDRITNHDIRTPLNTIIGLPEVLLQEPNLTDEQKEDLALISYSGRNVLEAMNLSMTILRIEAGSYRFEPERLDLAILVKQCSREQKAAAATKGVAISITAHGFNSPEVEHIMVLGDRLLAYSVISNLLKNAVDTSLENEAITIDLVRDELVTLSIKNKGLVPEEILSSFSEAYRTSGNRRGIGIGLYSARTFAEAQGWSIEIISAEPEGTTLTMNMPAAAVMGKNRTDVPER
jgi:two-component system sensor histidine kinase/response regulator